MWTELYAPTSVVGLLQYITLRADSLRRNSRLVKLGSLK
jgi:hypothetical protein